MMTIGIELGHHVTAVAVDRDGRVVSRSTRSAAADVAAAASSVYRTALGAATEAAGVGITLPFKTDVLAPDLVAALGGDGGTTPVGIPAGHALALAETWCGAVPGCRNAIAFSAGEHVTAGIIVGGTVLQGANGYAGSVAWLALNPVEREDYRRYGGLEAEIAAAGIVRRLVWRIKSGDHSGVVDQVNGNLSRLSASHVFVAARAGDGVCISVVRDTARYVGMAVSNLVSIVDPECVVLGGMLASESDLMFDAIRSECARRLRKAQYQRIRLELSTLGADAAAIGAARAALLKVR